MNWQPHTGHVVARPGQPIGAELRTLAHVPVDDHTVTIQYYDGSFYNMIIQLGPLVVR
jgi:hypothetical protein